MNVFLIMNSKFKIKKSSLRQTRTADLYIISVAL